MAKERLDKILSNSGYGTRKDVKAMIKKKRVVINGVVAKDPAMHVDTDSDDITIDDEKLNYRKYIYLMMNKPQGVISATEDNYDETVVDLLSDEYKFFNPAPVGRLDKDTEGLLILTNDGDLNHRLISPKKHVPKKYYAVIEGKVTEDDVVKFREGVTLDDGYKALPGELEILKSDEESEINVIIYEGKYHQVKRMFEAVGKKVVFLKRMEMGALKLDASLDKGEYRELTEDELAMLM